MPYEDLLTQTATLQRATVTRNATTGDEVESWVTQEAGVACYVRAVSERSSVPLGLADSVTHRVHLRHRTDVMTGRWRAIIEGAEYRIVTVLDPGNRHHHVEALARRMNA